MERPGGERRARGRVQKKGCGAVQLHGTGRKRGTLHGARSAPERRIVGLREGLSGQRLP